MPPAGTGSAGNLGEDDGVGTEQPKQAAEQQHRIDAPAAAGRVGQVHELRKVFDQLDEGRNSDQHRRDQDDPDARAARDLRSLAKDARRAGQVRGVEDRPARLLRHLMHDALTGVQAVDEGRVGLVGDPVIVLDDVDPAERENLAQPCEFLDRNALRFEGGTRQRALARTEKRSDPGDAVGRSGKTCREFGRKFEVDQPHELPERAVAEDHVHELRRLAAGRLDGDLHIDAVAPRRDRHDRLDDQRQLCVGNVYHQLGHNYK